MLHRVSSLFSALTVSFLISACGGDDNSTSSGDGDDSSSGSDTGGDSDSSGETDTGEPPPDCSVYCELYVTNCIQGPAPDPAGFMTNDECLAGCAGWAPGTYDDDSGNTIGCRYGQIMAMDCVEAGPNSTVCVD